MKFIEVIFKTFILSVLMIAQVHFSYAQTASILPPAKTTFLDSNGKPLAGGKVHFYIPGTTSAKTTWQDSGETIPNANPVVLDSAGRGIILGDGSYRQQVFDKLGNLIWDQQTSSTGSGGGGGTTATVGDGDAVGTVKPWSGFVAPNAYAFAYGQTLARASFPLLFSTLTSQQNVSCTSGSAVLSGVTDTSQLPIGAAIESICLNAGATVVSTTISSVTASANAIISTSTSARFFPFGNGDGSLSFNVPDLRGRVLAGRDNMGSIAASRLTSAATGFGSIAALGASGGNQSSTLVTANLPPYTPSVSISDTRTWALTSVNGVFPGIAITNTGTGLQVLSTTGSVLTSAVTTTGGTISATGTAQGGASTALNNVQPTEILNYIIKTLPDTNPNSYFGVASIGGMTGVITCGLGLTCSGNNISATTSIILPPPSATVLGGVFSDTCSTSNWFNTLDTTGTFGCSQPTVASISGWGTGVATALGNALNGSGGLIGYNSFGTGVATALGNAAGSAGGIAVIGSAGAFSSLSATSTVSGAGFSTYLASPPAIGGTAPAAGSFTVLGASGNVTLPGLLTSGTVAGSVCQDSSGHLIANTGGDCFSSGGASQWITSGSNIYYNVGKVGIGTSSPSNDITVLQSSNSQSTGGFKSYNSAGTSSVSMFQDGGGNSYLLNNAGSGATSIYPGGGQPLVVNANGSLTDGHYTTPGCLANDASGNISTGCSAPQIAYTPPGTGGVATTVQTELVRQGIWANDFGAVCNGSTNDSTAFQNAINEAEALTTGMRFTNTCAIATALSVTTGIEISGLGQPGASEILITNTTQNGIVVNTTAPVYFHDFSMNYSSLPTGGEAEIIVTATGINSGSRFERLNLLSGGQNCIILSNAAYWTIVNSQIACQSTGIQISNAAQPDAGDSTISGSLIQAGIGGTAILWNSSGGLRIENNKILGNSMTCGICFTLASGVTTADVFVIGNSIEGVSGNGIQFNRAGSTGALGTVIVNGNELSGNFGLVVPTDANGVWMNNIVVTNNICVTCGTAGFSLDSIQGLVLTNNFIQPSSSGTVPVAVGTHGTLNSTNCVIGPNPHLGTAAASNTGSCTAIAPN